MENKKPSIEEIFKNGVTVDYELYKSDYVDIKEEDIHDKYVYMFNKVHEFLDINKDVSEECLKLFLKEISKSNYYNKYINKYYPSDNYKILFYTICIRSIINILKRKNDIRAVMEQFICLIAADMYFKLIKLLNDYNVDISKPIIIRQQLLEYNSVVIGKPMIIDQSTEIHSEIVKLLESNNDVDMNKPIIIQQLLHEDNNTFIGKPMIIDHKQLQAEEKARFFTSHLSELLGIEKAENGQADFQEIEKRINLLLEKEKHYMKIVEYMKDYRENIENF